MNDKDIIIKKIENTKSDFIAFFKSDFLRATYCLCFKDTVFGAVSLNNFVEMIKYKYNDDRIKLVISDEEMKIKNPALLEQIIQNDVSKNSIDTTKKIMEDKLNDK